MKILPEPITRLIDELNKLPTIGPKTASRLAFYILREPKDDAEALARAIRDVKEHITYCSVCYNLSDGELCTVCSSRERDRSVLCVVEDPLDVLAIEKTHEFNGMYHILHGHIDPLNNVGPEDLRIRELINRVKLNTGEIKEVILALNPSVESRPTAHYLHRQLVPTGVHLTQLATGLPAGGDLEYADEITLSNALKGRRSI
ncbi:MAG: recombination protein RecR [Chloroflexi bacterium]|uniref:Recombination protein RecR n=1 Tax=Candidatus Chlorohelix allophototropha TaxID=3003348 RepID=A0A8T7M031_9CHLR|nr:recombination protein RecR [Chloroflexota bacterium]WJW66970.1 recombination mediator RecR [Chloroflexota bacterium L227-S17]